MTYCSCFSVSTASIPLTCTPAMVNPNEVSLTIQAAVKNAVSGTVFYFTLPVFLEAIMVPSPAMDVQALVAAWKSIDDTMEVSAVVNGKILYITYHSHFIYIIYY